MDKQMIEEMANLIHHTEFVDISGYEEEKIAEELLKYYQPKLPEDAVVLTRKDREEFNELYRSALQRAEKWEKLCGIKIKETRKEMAEKFAERVNQAINAYRKKVGEDEYVIDARRLIFEVNEICKEITDKGVQNGN